MATEVSEETRRTAEQGCALLQTPQARLSGLRLEEQQLLEEERAYQQHRAAQRKLPRMAQSVSNMPAINRRKRRLGEVQRQIKELEADP